MPTPRENVSASYETRRRELIDEAKDDVLHQRPLTAAHKREAVRLLNRAAQDEEEDNTPPIDTQNDPAQGS